MKTSLAWILVFLIFIPENASGQVKTYVTDSVPVLKPESRKNIYHFKDSTELILKYRKKAYLSRYSTEGGSTQVVTANNKLRTSTKVIWKLKGIIRNITDGSNWDVIIFCEGKMEKPAEMDVTNGMVSSKEIFRWNKGAYGSILDKNDTIGIFLLSIDSFEDGLQDDFLSARARNIHNYAFGMSVNKLTANRDFIINGLLKGKKFTIVSNGSEYKTWIYMPDGLDCVFFSDIDKLVRKKTERPVPFAIVDNITTYKERCDLFRLAMLSKMVNEIISIRFR